jgi:anaerobic nitric oxide reductase transcription regulator
MADNGTLFLDEIGELSLALQAKLLRVLQCGDVQRVGDDRLACGSTYACWQRPTATCAKSAGRGNFRADLFHRLSVFPLSVPPLCARRG